MSAYVVNRVHIDALVWAALDRRDVCPGGKFYVFHDGASIQPSHDELGQTLLDENVASVGYRYPDTADEPVEMPGSILVGDVMLRSGDLAYAYNRPRRSFTPVEILKALDGYEYQACERPEWTASLAYAYVQRLRKKMIGALPGYEEADTWGIS